MGGGTRERERVRERKREELQALDIARRTTIARVKKCCQIMGRLENRLTAAQVMAAERRDREEWRERRERKEGREER